MIRHLSLAVAFAILTTVAARAQEKLPPGAQIARMEASPAEIMLKHPYDYRQLLITAHLASGEKLDVTRMAPIVAPANLVKVSPVGLVRPSADGKGELTFSLGGQSVKVPVAVIGQKEKFVVNFVRDVMPTMSKLGCNAGTCHGSAEGKNGFKLSLRGYDPQVDYRALTDDLEARRFNRAAPERSLMLLKPSGGIAHTGGVLMQPGDPAYDLLRTWIAEGAQFDPKSPRVAKLDIGPKGPMLPLFGMKQQMTVMATYTDGLVRDVTAEAFVDSSNTEIATVDKAGLVTAVRRGEATVLARYEGSYDASTLIVMGDRSGFAWKEAPQNNYIDGLVYEKLKKMKILPSELCADDEFLRRINLDLTGLPPSSEQVRAFLADSRPTKVKRDEVIDKLIGSPEFIEYWTNKWADLLQVNRKFLGDQGAAELRKWIRNAIDKNMPYDQFARTILTASGSNVENPPASYFKVLRDADTAMENTTQLFLAIRFNCNKCHDHPFERWTQDQYYQMASFFAQVSRKEDPKFKGQKIGGSAVEGAVPMVEIISDTGSGEVTQIRTGVTAKPTFPFTHKDMPETKGTRREQLAHWVATKDNPYFARSYVNRIWAYLLGVGIIEPIDDIRAGNPPSNPPLLERLTNEFIAGGFNAREVMRTICKSRVYQQSIETNKWNADDDLNYSHAMARRLPAEVLFDAIHKAVGSPSRLPGLPVGASAAQLIDSSVPVPGGFLELFGKPPRESSCECERSGGMMLGPVLNMVNGPVVGESIKDPSNRLAQFVAKEKDDRKVVEEIFVAVLNRLPNTQEVDEGVKALHGASADFQRLSALHQQRLKEFQAYEAQVPTKQAAWEKKYGQPTNWETLEVTDLKSSGGATLTKQKDGSVLASGKNPSPEVYTMNAATKLTGITAVRLEVLTDPSLPKNGPGRAAGNANFVLNEFKMTLLKVGDSDKNKPKPVEFKGAAADYSQPGFDVAAAIDNNPATGWAIDPQGGKPHTAMFKFAASAGFSEGTQFTITMDQRYPGKDHNIGKFRISVTTSPEPQLKESLPKPVMEAIAVPVEKRTPEQKAVGESLPRPGRRIAALASSAGRQPRPARRAPARSARPGLGADQQPGVFVQPLRWMNNSSPQRKQGNRHDPCWRCGLLFCTSLWANTNSMRTFISSFPRFSSPPSSRQAPVQGQCRRVRHPGRRGSNSATAVARRSACGRFPFAGARRFRAR